MAGRIASDLSRLRPQWVIQHTQVTLGSAAQGVNLVTKNPLRWGITFSVAVGGAAGATGANVAPGGPLNTTSGIPVAPGTLVTFNYRANPALTQEEWWAANPGTPSVILDVFEELTIP